VLKTSLADIVKIILGDSRIAQSPFSKNNSETEISFAVTKPAKSREMPRKMDSVENFCGNYLYHHSSDSFVITLTTALSGLFLVWVVLL